MPHIPDLRTHATHDLELVAAYAAGDAAGADLETATALVSGCAECAALHHDLRAIAAALPDLPAPARPRDFRLTPEQAASLRPAGWRRLLGALAGPRFRLATPLGTGLATLGLAGLLVGTLAGIPLGSGAASAPGPAAGTSLDAFKGTQPELASAAPSADDSRTYVQGRPSQVPNASELPGVAVRPMPYPAPSRDVTVAAGQTPDGLPGWPVVAASLLALVVGVALIGGRLLGRRLGRAG